jgi:NAD(P)H-dependent FMN reductase
MASRILESNLQQREQIRHSTASRVTQNGTVSRARLIAEGGEMSNSEILVLSTSLNKNSRSKLMARVAHGILSAKQPTDWIDLQEYPLPLCDGGSAYGDPNVVELGNRIKRAKCILVATPIYNFDVNAALKNLIELTGRAWEEKTVGFLCAAGGKSSYMLDFRTFIIPRFVYADGEGFDGDNLAPSVQTRIEELCTQTIKLHAALYPTVKV